MLLHMHADFSHVPRLETTICLVVFKRGSALLYPVLVKSAFVWKDPIVMRIHSILLLA